MTSNPVVYTDDPDASWDFEITDRDGNNLTFTPLDVAAGAGAYATITGTWLGSAAPVRMLRVPLDSLAAGNYTLYLKVPGANDIRLGDVAVYDRT